MTVPRPLSESNDSPVLVAACSARTLGLSLTAIRADGSKGSVDAWKKYQATRASFSQIHRWWTRNPQYGLALICGAISQWLETLDFDRPDLFDRFVAAAEAVGLGDLVARLIAGYCERTPNDGRHLPYHCPVIAGNQVLAATAGKSLIETRGEGGSFICAPSCGAVHPSGKPYVLLSGSFATIAVITPEERQDLLALARTFDERPRLQPPEPRRAAAPTGERPGDDFTARVSWD